MRGTEGLSGPRRGAVARSPTCAENAVGKLTSSPYLVLFGTSGKSGQFISLVCFSVAAATISAATSMENNEGAMPVVFTAPKKVLPDPLRPQVFPQANSILYIDPRMKNVDRNTRLSKSTSLGNGG